MIKHIVLVKLKENTEENVAKTKEVMLSLKENIDLVRTLEVHADMLHAPDSFDVILEATFDNAADLGAYAAHPYHTGYAFTELGKYGKEVRIIDYEF